MPGGRRVPHDSRSGREVTNARAVSSHPRHSPRGALTAPMMHCCHAVPLCPLMSRAQARDAAAYSSSDHLLPA